MSASFSKFEIMADNSAEVAGAATTPQSYKWTGEDMRELIPWRAANANLFTGRRNATLTGFEEFIKKRGLEGKLDSKAIRKRWENLVMKYKALKHPRTGVSTEGGEATAASWKWYTLMDAAIGSRPSVEPPVLFASSNPEVARALPPSAVTPDKVASTMSTPKRRRVDMVEILDALKENERQCEEAMQEMEREQHRREEKREREAREAAEREQRRHQEAVEREERRHCEATEREERLFREMREREDRREREMAAREREAAAREERLLAILDKICYKL